MTDRFSEAYWNQKWTGIISKLPDGGDYFFNHRQYGYDIIKASILDGSRVFDFACGLGIIDRQLREEKKCRVSGCDLSSVAVAHARKITTGDFRKGSTIFGGPYDAILAIQFLEHIDDPVEWCRRALGFGYQILAELPNNFRRTGEHTKMAWTSWENFFELFKEFLIDRLDLDMYPENLQGAFKHPVVRIAKCN